MRDEWGKMWLDWMPFPDRVLFVPTPHPDSMCVREPTPLRSATENDVRLDTLKVYSVTFFFVAYNAGAVEYVYEYAWEPVTKTLVVGTPSPNVKVRYKPRPVRMSELEFQPEDGILE